MISDNIATLFTDTGPGLRFRQGVITFWDNQTGENNVDMGGGTLTDVPILNTGEAIALKAGHVVALLGQGQSWFIIGRVTPPNDPNFASASVAFASVSGFQQGFSVPAANTIRASTNLVVPDWADEAAVIVFATASVANGLTSRQQVLVSAGLNGGGGGQLSCGINPSTDAYALANLSASHSAVIANPGPTINVNCQIEATGNLGTNGFNTATTTALAVFRSTV